MSLCLHTFNKPLFTSAEPNAAMKIRTEVNKGRGNSLVTLAGIQSRTAGKQRVGVRNGLEACCPFLEDYDIAFPRLPTVTEMTFEAAPSNSFAFYANQRLVKQVTQKPAVSPSNPAVRFDFSSSASLPTDSCSPD